MQFSRETGGGEASTGERLSRLIRRAGVSNRDVAEWAGVHPGTVSAWRNDRQAPSDEHLEAIAPRLGVTAAELRYGRTARRIGDAAVVREVPPRVPPAVYAAMHACVDQLKAAGLSPSVQDLAEAVLRYGAYSPLSAIRSPPTDADAVADLLAAFDFVRAVLARQGIDVAADVPLHEESTYLGERLESARRAEREAG